MSDLIERLRGPVREAASRLIAGAFRRDGERLDERRPRFSIPARPDEDDDLILIAAIEEAADRIAALEADGWLTIDTAPKDRRILLGRFSGDKKDEYDTYCAVDRWKHPTAGYSYTGWGQFNATHWPPTHWREIGRPA